MREFEDLRLSSRSSCHRNLLYMSEKNIAVLLARGIVKGRRHFMERQYKNDEYSETSREWVGEPKMDTDVVVIA